MKMLKLQFEVDEDANEQIVSYIVLTKVKTKREYINNALALLRWAIDARIEGRSIASVDEGHTTAEIATTLGKRYQHVRNVLTRPMKRGPQGRSKG